MCDIAKPVAIAPSRIDRHAAELETDWEAVARYRVYRSEFSPRKGSTKRTLHSGKTYDEARRLQAQAAAALKLEHGHREDVMSRPIISIEVENCEATFAAFKKLRAEREARESTGEMNAHNHEDLSVAVARRYS